MIFNHVANENLTLTKSNFLCGVFELWLWNMDLIKIDLLHNSLFQPIGNEEWIGHDDVNGDTTEQTFIKQLGDLRGHQLGSQAFLEVAKVYGNKSFMNFETSTGILSTSVSTEITSILHEGQICFALLEIVQQISDQNATSRSQEGAIRNHVSLSHSHGWWKSFCRHLSKSSTNDLKYAQISEPSTQYVLQGVFAIQIIIITYHKMPQDIIYLRVQGLYLQTCFRRLIS